MYMRIYKKKERNLKKEKLKIKLNQTRFLTIHRFELDIN